MQRDLICFTGTSYENRTFSGGVINGQWIDAEDIDTETRARVERTPERETTDAPVEQLQPDGPDGPTDFYYYLAR